LLTVRWRLLRGDVVISDRYLCDFEVELSVRLQNQPYLASVLLTPLRWLAARPQRAYLLRAKPEVAGQRAAPDRGDLDLADMLNRYDALVGRHGLRVYDGILQFDELATALVHDALSSYMASFQQLVRALFFSNPWQLNPQRRQEEL
jgi:hypothetical protein